MCLQLCVRQLLACDLQAALSGITCPASQAGARGQSDLLHLLLFALASPAQMCLPFGRAVSHLIDE